MGQLKRGKVNVGIRQLIKYFPYSGSSPWYTAHVTDCASIFPNLWDVSRCPDEKAEVKSQVIDIHLTHGNAAIRTRFFVIMEPGTPSLPLDTRAQGSVDRCLS